MAERRDKVETTMDPRVVNVLAIDSALVLEILAKLFVNVVFYCSPTVEKSFNMSQSRSWTR